MFVLSFALYLLASHFSAVYSVLIACSENMCFTFKFILKVRNVLNITRVKVPLLI